MQVNGINNANNVLIKQNFKGNNANTSPYTNFPTYNNLPLYASQAYVSPQIVQSYKEIRTIQIPYIDNAKMYELSNGHKVVIIQKQGPTTINTFVKGGSQDSPIISHLLEHLIYNGENKLNSEEFKTISSKLGLTTQAETQDFCTNYFIQSPFSDSENINDIVRIQASLIQNPNFSKEKFEKEKNVIFAEYERTDGLQDKEYASELFKNTLLNSEKKILLPDYSKQAIDKTSFEEIMDFYNLHYQNKNMVSVIVGDVNTDETLKLFSKYFNKPNNITTLKQPPSKTPLQQAKRIDLDTSFLTPYNVSIGFVGPKNTDEKDKLLALMLTLYINEMSQSANQLNVSMDAQWFSKSPDYEEGLIFTAMPKANKEDEEIEQIKAYMHELAENPLSNEEFNLLKDKFKDMISNLCENSSRLTQFIGIDLSEGGATYMLNEAKLVDSLTANDLQDFAKKYLDTDKALTMVLNYNPKSTNINAPSFKGSPDGINTDHITEYNYPNNLKLIVDTSPGITRTTFSLKMEANEKPKAKAATVDILNTMLQAQSDYSNRILAQKASVSADLDNIDVSINTIPENTKGAIMIAKFLAMTPGFQEKLFLDSKNRNKNIYKLAYNDIYTKLNDIAYKDAPQVESYSEKLKYIDEITLSDVIDLYNQIISKSQGTAVLSLPQETFNKNKDKILSLISKDMPELQKNGKINPATSSEIKPFEKTRIAIKEQSGDNSEIAQSFRIPGPKDLDIKGLMTLELLLQTIGRGGNSKLFSEIREDKGLAYDTETRADAIGGIGYMHLVTELPLDKANSDDLKQVLTSYKEIIDDLVAKPMTEEELQIAKNNLKASYLKKLETSTGRNYLFSNMNIQDAQNLFKTIDSITSEDIQNFVKQYLDKPSLIMLETNQEVIDINKDYLLKLGEIV